MLIQIKKLGNHWYLDIPHDDPADLVLPTNIERLLNRCDKFGDRSVDLYFILQEGFIVTNGLMEFTDADILRCLTTDDCFTMDVTINGHHIPLSSNLYKALEKEYHFDFHKELYRIEIYEI